MLTPALQVHTMPPQHINVNFNLMLLNYIIILNTAFKIHLKVRMQITWDTLTGW